MKCLLEEIDGSDDKNWSNAYHLAFLMETGKQRCTLFV